jgi:hypothetical protein
MAKTHQESNNNDPTLNFGTTIRPSSFCKGHQEGAVTCAELNLVLKPSKRGNNLEETVLFRRIGVEKAKRG